MCGFSETLRWCIERHTALHCWKVPCDERSFTNKSNIKILSIGHFTYCLVSPENIHAHPKEGHLNSEGVSTAKIWERGTGKYEAELEIPGGGGWEGSHAKTFLGEVWVLPGTRHSWKWKSRVHTLKLSFWHKAQRSVVNDNFIELPGKSAVKDYHFFVCLFSDLNHLTEKRYVFNSRSLNKYNKNKNHVEKHYIII